jgi:hypothetical protein
MASSNGRVVRNCVWLCATLALVRRQILTATGTSVTALSTLFVAWRQAVCCKRDIERGLYCRSLNKYLTFQNELRGVFEPLTIVPRNAVQKELRADQLDSLKLH